MRNRKLIASFRHSAPYVNKHRNRTFVIMLTGEALCQPEFRSIINDIALLNSLGIKLVLVYGARPQINQQLSQLGRASHYHKGVRITDEGMLETIKQVAGALQLEITARLSMSLSNTPMQGAQINVVSGNYVIAQPLGVDEGVDYLHSGRVRRIDVSGIRHQLQHNNIVLIGPVAASVTGESFNLTAEEIATQVAIRLKADKIIGFASSQGVEDEQGLLLPELRANEAELQLQRLASSAAEHQELCAFLRMAIKAARQGVERCHLVSHSYDGAMLQELFSRDGIGTQVVTESAEQIRSAEIGDIGGILDLIRPLEEAGILVRRSREQLEMEIPQFSVIERDGLIIACAALYPFAENACGELACLAVRPEYRDADRGQRLLERVRLQAKTRGFTTLFALTTRSIHWFLEQGFVYAGVEDLPQQKRALYNFQRGSKILALHLTG